MEKFTRPIRTSTIHSRKVDKKGCIDSCMACAANQAATLKDGIDRPMLQAFQFLNAEAAYIRPRPAKVHSHFIRESNGPPTLVWVALKMAQLSLESKVDPETDSEEWEVTLKLTGTQAQLMIDRLQELLHN